MIEQETTVLWKFVKIFMRSVLLKTSSLEFYKIFGSRYSRMDQVKLVKDSLFTWSILEYLDPFLLPY